MAPSILPTRLADRAFPELFNVEISDPSLPPETFRAAGVSDPDGNKKLALIGDTILQLYLQKEGFERGASRGRINDVVSSIANNANLAQRGREIGLDRYIQSNPSQGRDTPPKVMTSTVEAIIGAVFMDKGWDLIELGKVIDTMGLSWPE